MENLIPTIKYYWTVFRIILSKKMSPLEEVSKEEVQIYNEIRILELYKNEMGEQHKSWKLEKKELIKQIDALKQKAKNIILINK